MYLICPQSVFFLRFYGVSMLKICYSREINKFPPNAMGEYPEVLQHATSIAMYVESKKIFFIYKYLTSTSEFLIFLKKCFLCTLCEYWPQTQVTYVLTITTRLNLLILYNSYISFKLLGYVHKLDLYIYWNVSIDYETLYWENKIHSINGKSLE